MIPYGHQSISEEDIAAVVDVLRGEWLTQGPAIERFEAAVADYCGVKHAVAVANGTAALHAAVWAAGLGPGDLLWTVPNTFVASANCARYVGADVDFVDIDPATLTMDARALESKLLATRESGGRLPEVVVPVHFAGQPCDMALIGELARDYGFRVIEDAAHAIGATYRGVPVGSCEHSDAATFSFHPVKIITTGEGGMVVTNDDIVAARAREFRTHGITRDPARMSGGSHGEWYYEQIALGYNYRMTDIQAALGASQMKRLDEFVERRIELAERYRVLLAGLPLVPQAPLANRGGHPESRSAWHLFVVQLTAEASIDRGELFDRMRAAGVGVQVHYIPVHLHPYYRELGFGPGMFPQAEQYYQRALTLPLYPAMTEMQQDAVVDALREALEEKQ